MTTAITPTRLTLAAIAGGVVLFIWGFAAWMLLPLHNSIKPLPDEKGMISSMQRANAPRGVYFYGGPDRSPGPQALVVYTPFTSALSGGQLARSFVFDVLSALAVAWLLSRAAAKTFRARVFFVIVAGALIAAVITDLANWNWFAYPVDYTIASMADKVIGWALAGLALAAIVRPCQAREAVA